MKGSETLQEPRGSMGPTRLAEPPPARGAGDRGPARWVAAGAVGFGGFATEVEAARAAGIAHIALARREAQSRGAPAPADAGPLAIVRREAHDVVLADGHEIATLVRALGGGAAGEPCGGFGFELRLPPSADDLHARAASYLIDRALRSAGIAWPRPPSGDAPAAADGEPPPAGPPARAA